MTLEGVLWAVIAFLAVAALVFAAGGFVDAVALLTLAAFLTYCIIVLHNWRAQTGEQS